MKWRCLLVLICFLVIGCTKPIEPTISRTESIKQEFVESNKDEIDELTKKIETDTKNPDLYYKRGMLYFDSFDYKNTVLDMSKAINFDSENVVYYQKRGQAYYWLKDYSSAIADYGHTIKMDPTIPGRWYDRAFIYYDIGQYEKTLSDIDKTIELDPKNEGLKKIREKVVEKIAEIPGEKADEHREKGYQLAQEGKYAEALLEYDEAIRLDPKKSYHWSGRAEVWYDLKDYPKAFSDIDIAIKLFPGFPVYWSQRSRFNEGLKRYRDAIVDIDKAIELEKANKFPYENQRGKIIWKAIKEDN